jgi:translocator protein
MRWRTPALTAAAAVATAALGGWATDPTSAWYRSLRKPSWQPPPPAYALVWTPLYADIATTSALALERLHEAGDDAAERSLATALAVNLTLNAGWTFLFFRAHRPWLAAAECAVLTASSADLVRRTRRAHPAAGAALVPYPLWCGFATALTVAIARLNPTGTPVGRLRRRLLA